MPLLSKQKRKSKDRLRTIDGKYDIKACKDSQQLIDDNGSDASVEEFFNEDKNWGNDDDSGWDDPEDMEAELKIYRRLKSFGLVWKDDNHLEKIKRGPYKIGKTHKSTYYDKYGPNGSLTKAASGTKKITNFFKKSDI